MMNTTTITSFDNNNNTSNNNDNDDEARKKYENNNNNKRRTNHLPLFVVRVVIELLVVLFVLILLQSMKFRYNCDPKTIQFKQHNTATTTAENPKNPSSLTQKQDDSLLFITLSYDATASQERKCECRLFWP